MKDFLTLAADRYSVRSFQPTHLPQEIIDKLHEEEFTAEMSLEESRAFTRLTLSDESDATKLLGIPFGRETEIPVAIQNQRTVDDVIASADASSEASQGEEPQPPAE